jgi:hypothetical protein
MSIGFHLVVDGEMRRRLYKTKSEAVKVGEDEARHRNGITFCTSHQYVQLTSYNTYSLKSSPKPSGRLDDTPVYAAFSHPPVSQAHPHQIPC